MKLSICMPTYNFGKFIGETLESIIPQLDDSVEIVILDGASTDNTQEVVDAYVKSNKQICYIRMPKKGGIDVDMSLSVEHAHGEYCWLFSSDDFMVPGAISRVLDEIKSHLDVYLVGFDICSLDLKEMFWKHPITKYASDAIVDFSIPQERAEYCEKAMTTTAFFSFMSSLIIKRSRWMQSAMDPRFVGSCWAHAARILSWKDEGLVVKVIKDSFLKKRSFNDSFLDKGLVNRLGIAIDGYHLIADVHFGNKSFESYHLRRLVREEISASVILEAKYSTSSKEQLKRLSQLVRKLTSDRLDLRIFYMGLLILFPSRTFPYLRNAKQKLLNLKNRLKERVA